jgi:predicted nucleic acid-binding protein
MDVLEEMGLHYSSIEQRAAVRAGEMQRKYKQRLRIGAKTAGADVRTIPDFLVGAHALLQCTALITRDAGFFRDYFKGLKVIVPQAT